MEPADVESAVRILLAETGTTGHFGYARRNARTGELELVYALRGRDARSLLELVEADRRRHRLRRLVSGLVLNPREQD